MRRIDHEPRLQQQFVEGHEGRLRTNAIERYMKAVVHFREQLSEGHAVR